VVAAIRPLTKLPLDVHLMIERPERYISDFVKAGADIITVHIEASPHCKGTVKAIKEMGAKAGVSLNPATPLSAADEVIHHVDLVLIMSVNPGFGGQSFIRQALPRIKRMRAMIENRKPSIELEVDGGINADNAPEIVGAGADVLVAGNSVFKAEDGISGAMRRLREAVG
jgi:ribulose-phosphate 3-epimerase